MAQETLFPIREEEKAAHGARWWAGNWECRNHHGYYQSREGGEGPWQFAVYGFGYDDLTASIYRVSETGAMAREDVPTDSSDRITVLGRKYGRRHWNH